MKPQHDCSGVRCSPVQRVIAHARRLSRRGHCCCLTFFRGAASNRSPVLRGSTVVRSESVTAGWSGPRAIRLVAARLRDQREQRMQARVERGGDESVRGLSDAADLPGARLFPLRRGSLSCNALRIVAPRLRPCFCALRSGCAWARRVAPASDRARSGVAFDGNEWRQERSAATMGGSASACSAADSARLCDSASELARGGAEDSGEAEDAEAHRQQR